MRILVVVVDGLQPASVGAYGNEWVATPFLDRWAAEGVVFDQHLADCAIHQYDLQFGIGPNGESISRLGLQPQLKWLPSVAHIL